MRRIYTLLFALFLPLGCTGCFSVIGGSMIEMKLRPEVRHTEIVEVKGLLREGESRNLYLLCKTQYHSDSIHLRVVLPPLESEKNDDENRPEPGIRSNAQTPRGKVERLDYPLKKEGSELLLQLPDRQVVLKLPRVRYELPVPDWQPCLLMTFVYLLTVSLDVATGPLQLLYFGVGFACGGGFP